MLSLARFFRASSGQITSCRSRSRPTSAEAAGSPRAAGLERLLLARATASHGAATWHLVEHAVPHSESCGFQPGVDTQLDQQRLNVGTDGCRRDTSGAGQAPDTETADFEGRRHARLITEAPLVGRQDDVHRIVDNDTRNRATRLPS